MKKSLRSIISLLLISTVMLFTFAPLTALALESTQNEPQNDEPIISNVPISERYHIIENGYRGQYDLQEGIFGHQSAAQVNRNAVYFYSDGYFADAPEIYNPSLATMSLALSISAFNAMQIQFDFEMPHGSYTNLFRHAKVLLSDIGIKDNDIYVNESYDTRPTRDGIGMIMGAKEISIDSERYLLLPIAVRGGDYESEWASNVTLGKSGEAQGFSSAATKVIEQVESYINSSNSFDIKEALNNGKVKFWVVGYSRGGAVANITAKRLTEAYGEAGNSIYSYTFEAPSGGVDAAEVKEAWTYNGSYANIHNVLNAADLVPCIPPIQMGFKRYGVDHYNPGTEAGEITVSTYETPTGVTVTTRADNIPYVIGDEAYLERRVNMLRHLKAIDSTIAFSDELVISEIDIFKALTSGDLLNPIEEAEGITSPEWIRTFINDLQNWAANGTYSEGDINNGGYDLDFRDFYTSHTLFAGDEHTTLEVALQNVLIYGHLNMYNEEFVKAIFNRFAMLLVENLNVLDIYFSIIKRWSDLSEEKQNEYLEKIWNTLDGEMKYSDGTDVPKLTDFVTEEEKEEFKDSVFTLFSFIFLFVNKDYNSSSSLEGLEDSFIHILTLLTNIPTVIQGHYPEVCLAWLSTYDENYSNNSEKTIFAGTAINLVNDENNAPPTVQSLIDVGEDQTVISLSAIINTDTGIDKESINNGSAIYYIVLENGKSLGDWQLYRSPITLDTAKDTEYTIKAFAVRFVEKGEQLVIEDGQLRIKQDPTPEANDSQPIANAPTINSSLPIIITFSSMAVILIILIVWSVMKKRKASK